MSNAYGGIVNISFIVVFLVIVSGYLAFSVNYNKAFRVKNKIISIVETGEGVNADTNAEIIEYMKKVGYSNAANWTATNFQASECRNGYCIKEVPVTSGGDVGSQSYYIVATAVNIDIPIINNILPNMKIFQVSGTTKVISKL